MIHCDYAHVQDFDVLKSSFEGLVVTLLTLPIVAKAPAFVLNSERIPTRARARRPRESREVLARPRSNADRPRQDIHNLGQFVGALLSRHVTVL